MSTVGFTVVQHPDVSAAVTTTGTGVVVDVGPAKGCIWQIVISAVSGSSPTMIYKVQGSVDGVTWYDVDATNAITASLTAAGAATIKVYPGLTNAAAGTSNMVLPSLMRLAWTIGGTATPTFTFATHVALLP